MPGCDILSQSWRTVVSSSPVPRPSKHLQSHLRFESLALFDCVMKVLQRNVIQRNMQRYNRHSYPGKEDGMHLKIINAIKSGDRDGAITALRADILNLEI